MREEIPIDGAAPGWPYRLITSTMVPRPIAWVSTLSAGGVPNLAPHSFFTAASADPAVVQFTSVGRKDSLNNIEATGEFVIALTSLAQIDAVNATGTNYPAGIDEFAAVGIEREPSAVVKPWRVAGSPVAIECTLHSVIPVGNSFVVLGTVVHIAIDAATIGEDGLPNVEALAPVARLGRNEWSLPGEVRTIDRIPFEG